MIAAMSLGYAGSNKVENSFHRERAPLESLEWPFSSNLNEAPMDIEYSQQLEPLPSADASDEVWKQFANQRCTALLPHLNEYILDRFSYKPRYVKQQLHSSFGTISALTRQYDIYIRMFGRPDDLWPRERLVLARIGFKEQKAGHGRSLVSRLVELAPAFGYRYIGIECANANSSAFAERLGFTSYQQGTHWLAEVDNLRERLK